MSLVDIEVLFVDSFNVIEFIPLKEEFDWETKKNDKIHKIDKVDKIDKIDNL